MTKPSDLGYSDEGFILPPLNINPIFVKHKIKPQRELFFSGLKGIEDRVNIRRETIDIKAREISGLVKESDGQWIIWCGLDDESSAAKGCFDGEAVEVKGKDDPEEKTTALESFQDGKYKILVSKSKICGFGMNFQNANNAIFFGMNDS